MKEKIKQLLKKRNIEVNDLVDFIILYLNDRNKKYSQNELNAIIQLFQLGVFDLTTTLETACIFYNYPLQKLYDKNGEPIMIWIAD